MKKPVPPGLFDVKTIACLTGCTVQEIYYVIESLGIRPDHRIGSRTTTPLQKHVKCKEREGG